MKDFLFIFRGGMPDMSKITPEQMQMGMKMWTDWYAKLGESIKDFGAALQPGGKHVVAKTGTPADNPFQKKKDMVTGYAVVKAKNYTEATKLAKSNPHLMGGGTIEVREVMPMEM
jgi:hypothetical protein